MSGAVAARPRVIDRCEAIYEDLALGWVREWTRRTGRRAFGYMPVYFPRELVDAAGMLPVGLMGAGDLVEIIKGDAFFQSYICHIPRSTVEMGLGGHLDCLSGMAFPAICDVIRNLSGMWKLMFPDKETIYFDVPQNLDLEIGGAYLRAELRHIAARLSQTSGVAVDDAGLRAAITRYNRHREWVDRVYARRSARPWEVPSAEIFLLMRAGMVVDVDTHVEMMESYLDQAAALERTPMDNSRVVLTGAFCEQPPIGLIRALERSGCYIVDDDFALVHRFIRGAVATDGDPWAALAAAYLQQSMDAPFKYQPARKGEQLKRAFCENRAEGVLFCAPSFCDPALLDRPMVQQFLDREGIPYTSFKYAENTGQFQVIKEQAGTFSDSLKLWGGTS